MPGADTLPPEVVAALKSSGFPFQTAIAHLITAAPSWAVYASEFPWRGLDGETHFLDLIATNGVFFLAIECKKTRKEMLTFLRPLGGALSTGPTGHFRCLRARDNTAGQIELVCEDWNLQPPSAVSEFCVVSTSESGKDRRLLERDAGLLIRATEAFADDHLRFKLKAADAPYASLVLPVIVTNAPLYTTRYEPTEISLETGEINAPAEMTKPECVRFF
jgi:hypothetical protein